MYFMLIYIAAFFCLFLFLVHSSNIYKLLFTLVFIDLTILSIIEVLPNQFKVYVLLLPLIILLILFIFTSFTIIGIISLLDYIFLVYYKQRYCPIKLQTLFIIWGPFKNYLDNNKNTGSLFSCFKLFLAFQIILLTVLKELCKKYYLLFFLYLFINNTLLIFFIYLNHILFFIILVSLLGMDPKVVKFLAPFFGDCVLAWLGSYQILEHDEKKIEFLHPDDYVNNKKFNQNLASFDKLQKQNNSLIVFLKKLLIKIKKNKKL